MVSDHRTFKRGHDAAAPSGPADASSGSADGSLLPLGVRSGLSWLDHVPTAVLATDRYGVIGYSNRAASALLKPPASGLAHRHLLDLVADEDRTVVAKQHRRAVDGERRPYSVVRLQSATRLVPCLLAAAPSSSEVGGEIVWVIARPGVWDVEEGDGRLTDLASVLRELSWVPLDATPREVVQAAASACRAVTGLQSGVSLSLRIDGRRELRADTSKSTQEWDSAQLVAGQGPVLAAAREATVVRSADLASDPRFPGLRGSIPSGHNAVSSPLIDGETVLGVLTAYDVHSSLLDPGDTVLPTLTAATLAIAQHLQARPEDRRPDRCPAP